MTTKATIRHVVDDATGCWIWMLSKNALGYGYTTLHGRRMYAHCAEYVKRHGEIPPGLVLDHLCRNASCVNPDHLEPVTMAENTRRGLSAKLTESRVLEIRKRYSSDSSLSYESLAKEYGISYQNIHHVMTGKTWRDVAGHELIVADNKKRCGTRRRLSEEDVYEIRRLRSTSTLTHAEIGKQFGVSNQHICRIVNNQQR